MQKVDGTEQTHKRCGSRTLKDEGIGQCVPERRELLIFLINCWSSAGSVATVVQSPLFFSVERQKKGGELDTVLYLMVYYMVTLSLLSFVILLLSIPNLNLLTE